MTTTIKPKRGGEQLGLGIYMGGSAIDKDYKKIQSASFRHATQLRNPKALIASETNLMKALDDTAMKKFNGKVDLKENESKELDKEHLLQAKVLIRNCSFAPVP